MTVGPSLKPLLQDLPTLDGFVLQSLLEGCGRKRASLGLQPRHPITQGIDRYFEIEHTEMYGEPFEIPVPEEQIFISWFAGGEVFRSGATWKRDNGKIFYFRPGHETYPIYYDENVKRVLKNAVKWAMPNGPPWIDTQPNIPVDEAPEPIKPWGGNVH